MVIATFCNGELISLFTSSMFKTSASKQLSFIQFGDVAPTWPSAPLRSPSPEDAPAPPNSRRGRANNVSRHPGMNSDVRTQHGNVGNTVTYTISIQGWKVGKSMSDTITLLNWYFGKNIADVISIPYWNVGNSIADDHQNIALMLAAVRQTPTGYCIERSAAELETP